MSCEDNSCVDADVLLALIDARQVARQTAMPREQDAIQAMFEAWQRLRELGWREGIYAPKDGTPFQIIEAGSTGIFQCSYSGKWPDGYFMTEDGRDVYPSRSAPMLYRLSPADEAARTLRMQKAAEQFAKEQS